MHVKDLVDTNILIYHSKGERCCTKLLADLIVNGGFAISIVTKIEFLGWHGHSPDLWPTWKALIEASTVYPLDSEVANIAIQLRRKKRIKLGDAVIAATSLAYGLCLHTRNTDDFTGTGVTISDPFTSPLETP